MALSRTTLGIVLVGILLAVTAPMVAGNPQEICHFTSMRFDRLASDISIGDFAVNLLSPDSHSAPTAWEGPIHVSNSQTGSVCDVSTVGLISDPLLAYNDHFLVLVTFSGSNLRAEVIDLGLCRESWMSNKITGPITVNEGRVVAGDGNSVPGFPCAKIQ